MIIHQFLCVRGHDLHRVKGYVSGIETHQQIQHLKLGNLGRVHLVIAVSTHSMHQHPDICSFVWLFEGGRGYRKSLNVCLSKAE